jgi:hypothetical protein
VQKIAWRLPGSWGEIDRLRIETESLLLEHWPAVEEVADELLGLGGEIEGPALLSIFRETHTRRQR